MPIPLILGGIALAAAGYGAKKGFDAKKDFDEAKKYNNRAKNIYDQALKKLENKKREANQNLEILGELKINIYQDSLSEFVGVFSEIKNIDFQDNLQLGLLPNLSEQNIIDLKETVIEIKEILGGGLVAIGSGALAGMGALGGVSALATASTGTAIASLSGAAATNATLAWLGGGSLAAGGFGMAGGMVVLGGIVTGPILAVSGLVASKKAEEAKYAAYQNYKKAQIAVKEMNAVCVVLDNLIKTTEEFTNILNDLDYAFEKYIEKLKNIINISGNNYRNYSQQEKEQVMIAFSIAQTIKNICDTPIIDEEGKITKKSKEILNQAKEINKKIEEL